MVSWTWARMRHIVGVRKRASSGGWSRSRAEVTTVAPRRSPCCVVEVVVFLMVFVESHATATFEARKARLLVKVAGGKCDAD